MIVENKDPIDYTYNAWREKYGKPMIMMEKRTCLLLKYNVSFDLYFQGYLIQL
jgi:hypothetical protein